MANLETKGKALVTIMHTSERLLGDVIERTGAFSPDTVMTVHRHGYSEERAPVVSVIVPVHNQENIIEANLQSIRRNLSESHEFIVIVDGCIDGTEAAVQSWAAKNSSGPATSGVTVIVVAEGVFETICDSIGARMASGEYLLEVQADMNIWEHGFDRVMIGALHHLPELVAVGGRGAHSFRLAISSGRRSIRDVVGRISREVFATSSRVSGRYRPGIAELQISDSIGRVGDLIECRLAIQESARPVFVHETVMRGPLAMRRDDFFAMGGFDTERFFLGNDDHDFAVRALVYHGRRVGYVPIGFDSPVAQGTTRASRSPEADARFKELKAFYAARFGGSELARSVGEIPAPSRYTANICLEA